MEVNRFVDMYKGYREHNADRSLRHAYFQSVATFIAHIGTMEDLQKLSAYFEQETKVIFDEMINELEEMENESITTAI